MVELKSLKSVWAFVFIFIHVDNLIKNSMNKYIWGAVHSYEEIRFVASNYRVKTRFM